MRFPSVIAVVVAAVLSFIPLTATAQSDTEWKGVEQALGRSGQLQPGDVFRIAMPRTDLKVKVQGIDVKAGFALGSYATFKKMGSGTMMMGDLVLLDEEIAGCMGGLVEKGSGITGVKNHLNEMSGDVMYMHYSAVGDPVRLATGLREALAASATPLGTAPAASGAPTAASGGPEIDQKQLEAALGRSGRMNNPVMPLSAPRAEELT